jgi:hypothetical protein
MESSRLAGQDARDDVELGIVEMAPSWQQRRPRHREDTDSTLGKNDAITAIEPTVPYKDEERAFVKRSDSTSEEASASATSLPQYTRLRQPRHPLPPITEWEQSIQKRCRHWSNRFLSTHPRTERVAKYLRGAHPPIAESAVRPFLPRLERCFDRVFLPVQRARNFVIPLFLIAWFLAFTFLVRASYFTSSTTSGAPQWIGNTDSFWAKDDTCGLNGTNCVPGQDSLLFRCPAQSLDVQLLNDRAVGPLEVIYRPLIVGGMDELSTYRADSWICAAAIHHGLFGNRGGGCGKLNQVGSFTDFVGGKRHGVESVGFATEFPSSYRFDDSVSQKDCQDLRDQILGMNVAMSTIFSFVIRFVLHSPSGRSVSSLDRSRPAASIFYWVLFCMGFWHVVLVSDPNSTPRTSRFDFDKDVRLILYMMVANVSLGFQYFLPALFFGYAFWRFAWRWVVGAFDPAIFERTVWYLGGFWVGLLMNVRLPSSAGRACSLECESRSRWRGSR